MQHVILGSHSSVHEGSSLLGCYAVSTGKYKHYVSGGSRCLPLQESCSSRTAWPRKCKHNVPSETPKITRRRVFPYVLQPFIITFDRTNCRSANMTDFHSEVPTRSENNTRYRFISECFDEVISSFVLIPLTLLFTMDFNRSAVSFQLCSK